MAAVLSAWLAVGAACWGAPGPGASPWSLRAWQTDDGLPENNVTGIAQGPDGYLWIATHGGVARFDGVRFQAQVFPGTVLRSNVLIRAMTIGSSGHVWVALEAERGQVIGFTAQSVERYTAADGLPGVKPLVMNQPGDGAVWVAYVDGSVSRLADGKVRRFGAAEGLVGTGGCWLAADSDGALWFAKAGRVGTLQDGVFQVRFSLPDRVVRIGAARKGGVWLCAGTRLLKANRGAEPVPVGQLPAGQAGVEPSTVFEDRNGGVWIGTVGGGLFHWDGREFLKVSTTHRDITSMAEDAEGNLWVGTGGGGLNRIRNRVLDLQGVNAGLPFETVRSVCEDEQGVIWAVGSNGMLARRSEEGWNAVSEKEGWINTRATCVAADPGGGVWVGTYRAGLFRWTNGSFRAIGRQEGLAGDTVRALFADSRSNLWVALEATNCLQRLDPRGFTTFEQPAESRTIRTMVEDRAGRIWLGTADGFLLRVHGDRLVDETARTLNQSKPIRCLYADPDGGLWIGFAGAGLGWLREDRFALFHQAQGLPDNYISGIQLDGANRLWFSASRGLFALNRSDLEQERSRGEEPFHVVDFGRNEGMPNLQGSYGYWPSTVRSRGGQVWFATQSGAVMVEAGRVPSERGAPSVLVESVTVDGLRSAWPGHPSLRLPPAVRRVEFDFTAFDFAAPDSLRFKYKLEGWDEDWSQVTAARTAAYSRLGAGKYRFLVSARSGSGLWSAQPVAVPFEVEPYLHQRAWFQALAAGCFIALFTWGIRSYDLRKVRRAVAELNRQQAVERERARIARDIHDELGTGLTQISLLADMGCIQTGDARAAEDTFTRIARRSRAAVQSLDEIVWAANPKNDCLPRLADYLCHLADDAVDGSPVRCRKEVPMGLPSVPIGAEARHHLALCVQEALANALKHARARTVKLKLQWLSPNLVVTVEDDGIGFDVCVLGRKGDGLQNQAARMQEIGGRAEIVSAPAQGTRCAFHLRLDAQTD